MAAKTRTAQDAPVTGIEQDEWESVSEGAGLSVELEVGDTFIGIFASRETVTFFDKEKEEDKSFEVYHFEGLFPESVNGEHSVITPGYQLTEAFKKIDFGQTVKIIRTADVKLDNKRDAMKDYKVYVRR